MVAPVYRGQTLFFWFFDQLFSPHFCGKQSITIIFIKNHQKMQNGRSVLMWWVCTILAIFDQFWPILSKFRKIGRNLLHKKCSFPTKHAKIPPGKPPTTRFPEISPKSPNFPRMGSPVYWCLKMCEFVPSYFWWYFSEKKWQNWSIFVQNPENFPGVRLGSAWGPPGVRLDKFGQNWQKWTTCEKHKICTTYFFCEISIFIK